MSASRLRRYRHFPTLPDSRALLALLRMHAIVFETRYERGAAYGRGGHEPDRLEVWVRTEDYEQIKQLDTDLTREQAAELAENYLLITLPDDELRDIAAQAAAHPTEVAVAKRILVERRPYTLVEPAVARPAPAQLPGSLPNAPGRIWNKWLLGLLVLAAAYLAVCQWLT